jgi:hypothetical protein
MSPTTRIDYHGPDRTNPWEGKDARRAIVWDIGEAIYTRPPEEDRAWLAKLVRHALSLLDALEATEAERDALAGQLKAVKALRDRVSESVAIAAMERRKLTPVVAVAELDAVLGEEA